MLLHQLHRWLALCGALLIALPGTAATALPELVGSGTLSTPDDEFGIAFAPDGRTAYFTKRSPTTNTPPRSVICVSRLVGGRWSEPEIAEFSGTWYDMSVAVSADGRRIVIASDRPRTGGSASNANGVDLWTIDRDDHHWSAPRNSGEPLNSAANDAYPSLAADGTLYFASSRPGGKGSVDIWRARFVDGQYTAPENLADINTAGYDSQPAIAPDQSFIVFASSDRSDAINAAGAPYSRPDLYVSFHTDSGWSVPRHFDAPINSPASEGSPGFSADAHWLTFASDRSFVTLPMRKRLSARDYEAGLHGITNGWNNIYRVPIATIERLRPALEAGARTP
jgi:Tol biopolymer transport system component